MVSGGRRVAALIVALAATSAAALAGQAAKPGPTAPPLALHAACEGEGEAAILRVRVENRSDRDTAVLLGRLVGNDQTRVVDALVVMAIRLATGANEDFPFINPKHAMLTGRTTPWIETIRAGQTYEIEAPVRFFISRLNYSLLEPLGVGGTRMLLEARPAASAKVWTGTIETMIEPCP
jgi:hypothetical protein